MTCMFVHNISPTKTTIHSRNTVKLLMTHIYSTDSSTAQHTQTQQAPREVTKL